MKAKSRIGAILAVSLLAISATGCSTPRTVYVSPEFDVPPRPSIDLDRRALWDALGAKMDDRGRCLNEGCRVYRNVEDTIDSLIVWGKELEATAKEVSGKG